MCCLWFPSQGRLLSQDRLEGFQFVAGILFLEVPISERPVLDKNHPSVFPLLSLRLANSYHHLKFNQYCFLEKPFILAKCHFNFLPNLTTFIHITALSTHSIIIWLLIHLLYWDVGLQRWCFLSLYSQNPGDSQ